MPNEDDWRDAAHRAETRAEGAEARAEIAERALAQAREGHYGMMHDRDRLRAEVTRLTAELTAARKVAHLARLADEAPSLDALPPTFGDDLRLAIQAWVESRRGDL